MIQAQNPATSNHGKKYVIQHRVSGKYWTGWNWTEKLRKAWPYRIAPIITISKMTEPVMALQAFINL